VCISGYEPEAKKRERKETAMAVGRIIEISAMSNESFDDAVRQGIARASKTLRNITGAWVKDMRIEVKDGNVTGYQVNMQLTFLMEDTLS
jgi:hypothetical protein